MIGSCCWNVAWRLHPPGNMRLTLRKRLELGAPLHRSGAICPPGSRIQRRIPHRCYQVHYREAGSKCFSWGTDGEPPTQAYMCVRVCVCVCGNCVFTYTCMYIYIYIYTSRFLYFMKVCVHVSLLRRQHNDNRIAALPFRQRHSSRLCNGPGTDTKNPEPRALLRGKWVAHCRIRWRAESTKSLKARDSGASPHIRAY